MPPRVVLITGAGAGIGRASAVMLALAAPNASQSNPRPFKVVATDVSAERLQALQHEQPCIDTKQLDVTDAHAVTTRIAQVVEQEGRLDILINSAGIMPVGPVETLPMSEMRAAFEVNYWGGVNMMRAALPHLRAARGHIINISSNGGVLALPYLDAYVSTKFALEGLTEAMAATVPRTGVRVSLVEPGATATSLPEMSERLLQQATTGPGDPYANTLQAVWAGLKQSFKPENGAQRPEEVAEAVLEVIRTEAPHLRNITSVRVRDFLAVKLKDLEGDATVQAVQGYAREVWQVELSADG